MNMMAPGTPAVRDSALLELPNVPSRLATVFRQLAALDDSRDGASKAIHLFDGCLQYLSTEVKGGPFSTFLRETNANHSPAVQIFRAGLSALDEKTYQQTAVQEVVDILVGLIDGTPASLTTVQRIVATAAVVTLSKGADLFSVPSRVPFRDQTGAAVQLLRRDSSLPPGFSELLKLPVFDLPVPPLSTREELICSRDPDWIRSTPALKVLALQVRAEQMVSGARNVLERGIVDACQSSESDGSHFDSLLTLVRLLGCSSVDTAELDEWTSMVQRAGQLKMKRPILMTDLDEKLYDLYDDLNFSIPGQFRAAAKRI